jgi:hypothetical protein
MVAGLLETTVELRRAARAGDRNLKVTHVQIVSIPKGEM